MDAGQQPIAIAVYVVTAAAVLVVAMVSTALSQIFRVALYQYAVTDSPVDGFDRQLLQSAFVGRR